METEAKTATRRQFDQDTKDAAVKRVNEGESKSVVAKDLDIHVNVLRGWLDKAGTTEGSTDTPSAPSGRRMPVASSGARASLLEQLR